MPQDALKGLRQGKVWHKYRAVPTSIDGLRFDSKAEAGRYADLRLLQKAGEVVFFLRQVPFDLPGGVKYRADFMIFWADGSVTVEDVKGYDTPQSRLKRRQVEALYPVTIELVKGRR